MMKIDIKGLSFTYKHNEVLKDISFCIDEHEIVAVLGPNGAGKSTLLKCMNRVLKFKKGTVMIGEDDINSLSRLEIARKIGYVAQNNEAARITVFDAVLLGRTPHINYRAGNKDILITAAIIDRLRMKPLSLRFMDELSGGELQKVCIARALVQEPEVLLLDEPISSLDLKNQIEILRLLRSVVDGHNVSAVVSLHDINMAIHYADRIIFIKDKKIHAICRRQEITRNLVKEVYGIEISLHYMDDIPIVIPAKY